MRPLRRFSRRRRLSEALAHQELSLDLFVTASFDGYFTRVNPAWTRTLGHSEGELLARPFIDFVHSDDREPTIAESARRNKGSATKAPKAGTARRRISRVSERRLGAVVVCTQLA